MKTLEADLRTLQNDLEILLKNNEPLKYSAVMKKKKIERKECDNGELRKKMSVEILSLKNKRFVQYKNIQASQKAVSDLKQSLHFKRMPIRFHYRLRESTSTTKYPEQRQALSSDTLGLFKTSECHIPDPAAFVFSGTDNGLINMSTTTTFKLNRFKFYLKLYNRYQVLGDDNIENDKEGAKYLDLPKKSVINAADIDFDCRLRRARKKLENEKSSLPGKLVLEAEKALSKEPLDISLTIEEYLKNSKTYVDHSSTMRQFYGSSKRAIMSRTLEIQKQKFTNKLLYNEKNSSK